MMCVLSLIASPDGPVLDDATAAAVVGHLKLQDAEVMWLAPGVACDIGLPDLSEIDVSATQDRARAFLAAQPIDANIVAVSGRRMRLLIADMDSTVIEQECIDELGIAAGAGEQVKDVTRRAMRGELDFVEALRERVALMKDLPESAIREVIDQRITFVGGARTLVQTMKKNGACCALISGGFTQFTAHVAGICGFDINQANQLVIEAGRLTGSVVEPALGGAAKVDALNRLTRELGIAAGDALCVGDGANDLAMIEMAGLGVAMHAKPAVRAAAGTIIDHGDLTAPLYLQGYSKPEFVE